MEIKVGVQNSSRELSVECELTTEEVQKLVDESITQGTPLRLEDERGSVVVVPAAALAYVEIGSPKQRGVGFGML